MKRLILILGLTLLLALVACGGQQPDSQEVLPGEGTEVAGEGLATATPLLEAPPEGEVIGGNIIPTLTGTTWEWVDTTTPVETIVAVDPTRYTITFNDDGTANIMADCNSVTATYTGDGTFLGAPAAADRRDPRISARRSSTHEKTRYGWYRDPVTVRFTCAARGAPLVGGCPGKVVLRNNGAKRSVTRSVRAGDGGVGRATAAGINLDRTRPTVRISGPRSGHAYRRLPTARCVAGDTLSKVASCRIARRTTSRTARFTATATDKAGNVRTRTVTVRRR